MRTVNQHEAKPHLSRPVEGGSVTAIGAPNSPLGG